jgi:hypothetical protein
MTDVATDPFARQLIQHAEMISRLRHDLDQLASEITDAYADVVSRLESIDTNPNKPASTPTAWCWRTVGPLATDELLSQLNQWVTWIRQRYPLAKKIPPCWADHPETVEELTALWLAWQAAYEASDASLTAAADWHDRWLPGVLHRMEHGPFSLNCNSQHEPRPAAAYGVPVSDTG